MTKQMEESGPQAAKLPPEFEKRMAALLSALVSEDTGSGDGFEQLFEGAKELLTSKLNMIGTKSQTRTLLENLVTARLREIFGGLGKDGSEGCEPLAAEVVLGTVLSGALLADFSAALDRAILECSSPRDYSFAGRADFISLEEVLQLLGGAKHRGLLTLEKPDNRIDIYLDNSAIAFLDPHRFIRRVLPVPEQMAFREMSHEMLEAAEKRHAEEGVPIFLTLCRDGFFQEEELRDMMRHLGTEVLFEFLRDQAEVVYSYRRHDELPDFALQYNLKLPVTPILLEGNRRLDDWRSMLRVFPSPDDPLEPGDDMFSKISSLELGVLEIKMLAQINSKTTPRKLVEAMGLPLQDIYQYLVRFAKEGALRPPGGSDILDDLAMTIEESVEMAWQALDENDDNIAVTSALDKVLGDTLVALGDPMDGGGADLAAPRLKLVDGEDAGDDDDVLSDDDEEDNAADDDV